MITISKELYVLVEIYGKLDSIIEKLRKLTADLRDIKEEVNLNLKLVISVGSCPRWVAPLFDPCATYLNTAFATKSIPVTL